MNGFLTLYIEIFDQPHLDAALKELERLNIPVTFTTTLPPVRCIAIYIAKKDVAASLYTSGVVDKYEALQRSGCKFIKLRQLRKYFNEPVKVIHNSAGDVGVSCCDSLPEPVDVPCGVGCEGTPLDVQPVKSYTYSQRIFRKLLLLGSRLLNILRGGK